jgi:NADH dehydrogenase (ubiquinone) 1 alpha/beta subcomplex 1
MQTVRSVVLQHLRLRAAPAIAARGGSGRPALYGFARGMSAPAGQEDSKGSSSSDPERDIRTRVVNLVKKFDKIDADKVGSCFCPLFSSFPFPLAFFFVWS